MITIEMELQLFSLECMSYINGINLTKSNLIMCVYIFKAKLRFLWG